MRLPLRTSPQAGRSMSIVISAGPPNFREPEIEGHRHDEPRREIGDDERCVPPLLQCVGRGLVEKGTGTPQDIDGFNRAIHVDYRFDDDNAADVCASGERGIDRLASGKEAWWLDPTPGADRYRPRRRAPRGGALRAPRGVRSS